MRRGSVLALLGLLCTTRARVPSAAPSSPFSGKSTLSHEPLSGFVTARAGNVYIGDRPYNFASFNSPFLIGADTFEIEDAFRTFQGFGAKVTRTYTLSVQSINVGASSAHVLGWNSTAGDWIYNEAMFVAFDTVLALAQQYGMRLVHPIINQDYGSEESNYAGNWADLIRLRYNLTTYNATKAYDWWTDATMISSYKKLVSHLLTRKNTVNGRTYGRDDTFLAFETGNEMNLNGTMPPPGSWTIAVAEHIKSLAPHTLVLDGSLSRNSSTEGSWAPEALRSPYVDLFSYHYYYAKSDAYDYRRINNDSAWVTSHGKTFIVGEHGFYPNSSDFADFYARQQRLPVGGSMIWSLRPHASNGGFLTHGEGGGIFSYHAPGWSPQQAADFDPLEESVAHLTRNASYALLHERVPDWPVPNAPVVAIVDGAAALWWKGASWAQHYEVWRSVYGRKTWSKVADGVLDNVDAGNARWNLTGTETAWYIMRGVSVDSQPGPFSSAVFYKGAGVV